MSESPPESAIVGNGDKMALDVPSSDTPIDVPFYNALVTVSFDPGLPWHDPFLEYMYFRFGFTYPSEGPFYADQ